MAATDRALYLHEYIDIVGEGAVPYMQHTVAFSADAAADSSLRLFGTWRVMGSTGRWPQVVNLWEIAGGWDGWRKLCDRTNLRRESNAALSEWWMEAYRHRTGGFDRLLGAVDGCPTLDALVGARVRGTLFVHEMSRVVPGTGSNYLAAIASDLAPLMERYGHTLVGLYEVLFTDVEVCVIWTCDLDAHVALQRARDGGDSGLEAWAARRRTWCTQCREELLIPGAGTLLGPATPA